MSINRLGLVALGLCSVLPAAGETYQWELEGTYGGSDYGNRSRLGDVDQRNAQVSGRYYFEPVETDGKPLAEAAFLTGASRLSLGYQRQDLDSSRRYDCLGLADGGCQPGYRVTDESGDGFTLGFEGFFLNKRLYVSGYHTRWQVDRNFREVSLDQTQTINRYQHDGSSSNWSASVGVMARDNWLIAVGGGEQSFTGEDDLNLTSKYVLPLGRQALNLEATYYIDSVGYQDWKIGADYYLTRKFSVGVSYADSGDYELRLENFFTESLGVKASYEETDYGQFYNVGVTTRF